MTEIDTSTAWGLRVVYSDGRPSGLMRSPREVYASEREALGVAGKRNKIGVQRALPMRIEPVRVLLDKHGCPMAVVDEPPLTRAEVDDVVDEMRSLGLIEDAQLDEVPASESEEAKK